ncbi:hypothetical protein [Chishuiella sp.]|uniref:hypothetical protein n=1 Tax=Chishuiella sp. TaxID=1969467 RepID=UPI0028AC9E79|nr:hypothetical protein [Chishuiella sp.]
MQEIFNLLFHPLPNGIMTILMGFSLFYWIFQLLLGDGVDFDTDADIHLGDVPDADASSDIDADKDFDTDIHHEPSFFSKCLEFINVGKVPLMVLVTVFKFISWVITIITTTIFGLATLGNWSVLILIPIFLIVFILMHWISKPLVKMFIQLGYKGEEKIDFLGRVGTMKSTIENDKIGSAEFIIGEDIYTLNIISDDGSKVSFGETVVITDCIDTKYFYKVKKQITLYNF